MTKNVAVSEKREQEVLESEKIENVVDVNNNYNDHAKSENEEIEAEVFVNEDEDDVGSVSGQDASSVLDEAVGVENLDEVCERMDGAKPDTYAEENECGGDISVDLDCVCAGKDRSEFVTEVAQDPSLSYCRQLASSKERGYKWDNGILLHTVVDCVDGDISRIVDPKNRCKRVCEFAHDRAGHLGARKVCQMIQKCFTLYVDKYVKSVRNLSEI